MELSPKIKRLGLPAILFLALAAALILRCFRLGFENFWVDEVVTILLSKMDLTQLITRLNLDVHPPFFSIALKGWMALGFHGETGLRLLSVLFGTLSCFFIYCFGKLLYGRQAGIVAAVILAFSAYHVRYSQELRDYELLSFLSLLSFYFYEKASRNSIFRNYLAYFLTTCVLVYTHTFGFLTIFAQHVFFILSFLWFHKTWARPPLRSWLITQMILLIAVLPWIATILYQSHFLKNDQWLPAPKISSLITVLKYYAGSWPLLLTTAAMFGAALYFYAKRAPEARNDFSGLSRNHTVLIIWIMVGIMLPFVASFIRSPIFLARRMIFASIPIYLLTGWAFSVLPSKKLKVLFALLFFIFSFFSLAEMYQRPTKEEWRKTAAYIDQKAVPGDLLLFHSAFPQLGFDFYSRRPELERKGFPEPENSIVMNPIPGKDLKQINQIEAMSNGTARIYQIFSLEGNVKFAEEKIQELDAIVAGRKTVWLIESFKRDTTDSIIKKMNEKFRIAEHKSFLKINIYRWERK